MNFNYIGAQIIHGTSNKTGQLYEIPKLLVQVPMKVGNFSPSYNVKGYGNEPVELFLDPSKLELFKDLKPGSIVELQTEMQVVMGKFEAVVIGFTPARPELKTASNG